MESSLAELVGSIIASETVGEQAFYALSTFSQRLSLAERVTVAGIQDEQARKVCAALFIRISRLWKTRNKLVHSPYVYRVDRKGGGSTTFYQAKRDLGHIPQIDKTSLF